MQVILFSSEAWITHHIAIMAHIEDLGLADRTRITVDHGLKIMLETPCSVTEAILMKMRWGGR